MYDFGCEFWELKKNWTIKMLLDYGYLEKENCITCFREKDCFYRIVLDKEIKRNDK